MTSLIINRKWSWFGCARALNVNVDGESAGKIGSSKTMELRIDQGIHSVQVSMDWCRSAPLSLEILENEQVTLKVVTQFLPIALVFCFVSPSKVFRLVII